MVTPLTRYPARRTTVCRVSPVGARVSVLTSLRQCTLHGCARLTHGYGPGYRADARNYVRPIGNRCHSTCNTRKRWLWTTRWVSQWNGDLLGITCLRDRPLNCYLQIQHMALEHPMMQLGACTNTGKRISSTRLAITFFCYYQ